MRKIVHRAKDRGSAAYKWLHTRYSFSFANWYDPRRMGFGALRVLNDDVVEPLSGFEMHSHSNMEIITIVTEGAVTHEDNMGNIYTVTAGDIQVMTAGAGITHAELNKSPDHKLALFQVWILPRERGLKPSYTQMSLGVPRKNTLELIVSGDEIKDIPNINQDAYVCRGVIADGGTSYKLKNKEHGVYIFVVRGTIEVGGTALGPRDAIGVWDTDAVSISAPAPAEILVFEVPMSM